MDQFKIYYLISIYIIKSLYISLNQNIKLAYYKYS